MQLKPINEQVVVVLGASSGIGRETALRFARRGAKVVASARDEAGLESLIEEIRADGGEAIFVPCEVAEFEQVRNVAERAVETYGRIDTWVHLAAVSIYATFDETTPEEFRRVVEVNLLGQAHGGMAALPYLKREGRGAFIAISSVEGKRALPYQSAYAASKHGVIGMLDAMRVELAHEGLPIAVTAVLPSSINTPFFNKARTKIGVKPMGIPPLYPPQEVARAILYAAEHPTREIIVGEAGKLIALMQRLSPELVDTLLLWTGFRGQKSNQPKSESAPDNLYDPLSGYDYVKGDYGLLTQPASPYNWLTRHPNARRVVSGAALAAATLWAARTLRQGA
ncbi:MAG TPA: SDR family oxidoreductase [Ardenticatenaceae bacterium]|jgi:NAD(P)-dependent dehydrogenase (short-subunit alcohol dehydrogenase family)